MSFVSIPSISRAAAALGPWLSAVGYLSWGSRDSARCTIRARKDQKVEALAIAAMAGDPLQCGEIRAETACASSPKDSPGKGCP